MRFPSASLLVIAMLCLVPALTRADDVNQRELPPVWKRHFESETMSLLNGMGPSQTLNSIQTKEEWLAKKDEYRRQLAEMLGLDPLPKRTDLHAVKTGEFEHDGIVVEKLSYQSIPGLYVTANLYRPKTIEKPLPAILYVCGHASMVKDGVSLGNKAGYEHHGAWYAKHGFVCLVIDTVELGEIRGEHHGTYKMGRWWWYSRGYTPAGLEAWSGMRGLDYLETRPEVDNTRFGVSGRSGGGAYSWYIAALDERVKAAAPTAGITTLYNHVVDGCVEGHCDCMFMVNTYRWDYDKVAALVAPRPLCIVNTDKDTIFPISGVIDIYLNTRNIYKLLGAEKNIGLQIAEGPHQDSQPLNTGEFHWMMRFLQGAAPLSTYDDAAKHSNDPAQLRVFNELPKDEINTRADEVFVPQAPAPQPAADAAQWTKQRDAWREALRQKCFGGWYEPWLSGDWISSMPKPLHFEKNGVSLEMVALPGQVDSDPTQSTTSVENPKEASSRLFIAKPANLKLSEVELIVLNPLDAKGWDEFANSYGSSFPEAFGKETIKPDTKAFEQEAKMFHSFKWAMAYFCPQGVRAAPRAEAGATGEPNLMNHQEIAEQRKWTQILRRYYLLGQTLDGQQVLDIRIAIHALRATPGLEKTKLWLQGERTQAGNVLYASLFEDGIARIDLHGLAHSHMPSSGPTLPPTDPASKQPASLYGEAPVYLNVLKYLDIPAATAMACERCRVVIFDDDKSAWEYPRLMTEKFDWSKDKKAGLQLRGVPKAE